MTRAFTPELDQAAAIAAWVEEHREEFERHAQGLDLGDEEDRTVFRIRVAWARRLMRHRALCAEAGIGLTSTHTAAVRQLADRWIERTMP